MRSLFSKIVITCMCFCMCVVLCTNNVKASTSPLAELYFEVFSGLSSLGDYNSAIYKTQIKTAFENMGYDAYAYTKAPAGPASQASVIRTLADDAVFMIHTHAGKGRVVCIDTSNNITTLSAKTVNSDNNIYSLEYNFDGTTGKLKTVKCAFFWGCNTYGVHSTYGSLNVKAPSLGVDVVITTKKKVYQGAGNYFLYRFAVQCNNGKNIANALSTARTQTLSYYGLTESDTDTNAYITVSNYMVTGDDDAPSTLKLKPAAYGSI